MGKLHDGLTPELIAFIQAQKMFFVGTAPLSQSGHVNVSPKGMDCLRVLGPRRLAYLDVTGSGVETISHVKENGRLVMMFCAFDGKPFILRVHGEAEVLEAQQCRVSAASRQVSGTAWNSVDHPSQRDARRRLVRVDSSPIRIPRHARLLRQLRKETRRGWNSCGAIGGEHGEHRRSCRSGTTVGLTRSAVVRDDVAAASGRHAANPAVE